MNMTQTSDDLAVQAMYGKGWGPAHKDQAPGEESRLSAIDPPRRSAAADDPSVQAGFAPARSIFGAAVDASLGLPLGVAGMLPADPDWEDAVDTQEIVIDDLPLEEGEPAMDSELRDWIAEHTAAVLTTCDLLASALHYIPDHITRAEEMELAESMQRLGYEKAQRRINGARTWVWVPSQTADSLSQT